MKLKISKDWAKALVAEVPRLKRALGKYGPWKAVYISAEGGYLRVKAGDGSSTWVVRYPAMIDDPGACYLDPASLKRLFTFPKMKEKGGFVLIEGDDETITAEVVGCPVANRALTTKEEEPPPLTRTVLSDLLLTVTGAEFRRALQRVIPSVSPGQKRYGMAHIHLEYEDQILRMVGTDGARLGMAEIALPEDIGKEVKKATSGLSPLLARNILQDKSPEYDVRIQLDQGLYIVEVGAPALIATSIINNEVFPAYRKRISGWQAYDSWPHFEVFSDDLLDILKGHEDRTTLHVEKGILHVRSSEIDAKIKVEAEGDIDAITVDPTLVPGVLPTKEVVRIYRGWPGSLLFIKAEHSLHVLAPMRDA